MKNCIKAPFSSRPGAVARRATLLGMGALLLALPLHAQDHMGMAELHGQGVVNTLQTDIRNSGIRSSMGNAQRNQPTAAPARWPAHINERSAASHVFTVAELQAMNNSDRERAARMFGGKSIVVQGRVDLPGRERNTSFSLRDVGASGFHVHVSWNTRKNGRRTVQQGQLVQVRGTVSFERRSFVSLRPDAVLTASNSRSR